MEKTVDLTRMVCSLNLNFLRHLIKFYKKTQKINKKKDSCEANPCLNNGTCLVNLNSAPYFNCICAPGYAGTNCSIKSILKKFL